MKEKETTVRVNELWWSRRFLEFFSIKALDDDRPWRAALLMR